MAAENQQISFPEPPTGSLVATPGPSGRNDDADDGNIDASSWLALLRCFLGGGNMQLGDIASSIDHIATDDVREQAGCALWDATISPAYAKLLIDHSLVDVVLAVLELELSALNATANEHADVDPPQPRGGGGGGHRIVEISIGILGNICAHKRLATAYLHPRTDMQQLLLESVPWLPDPPCVGELARLLSVALRQQAYHVWLQQLSAPLLSQLLFVCVNTLHSVCLARCLDVLVAIISADRRLQRDCPSQHLNQQPDATQALPTPAVDLTEPLLNPTPPSEVHPQDTPSGQPTLTSQLLSLGLLDVLASVLAIACRQLQSSQTSPARPLPSDSPNRLVSPTAQPGRSGPERGSRPPVGSFDSPPRGEAADEGQEVTVVEDALDAILRMLEELAATPEGRAALMDTAQQHTAAAVQQGQAAPEEQPQGEAPPIRELPQGRGVHELPQGRGVHELPQGRGVHELPQGRGVHGPAPPSAQLPSLMLQLLMLSDSPQVLEGIVIVLLEVPRMVLPLLLQDPRPLSRLLDALPEVGSDEQEQVIAATWYLTAATLQDATRLLGASQVLEIVPGRPLAGAPDPGYDTRRTQTRSSQDRTRTPERSGQEESTTHHPTHQSPAQAGCSLQGDAVMFGPVDASPSQESVARAAAESCLAVVARLQHLPVPEGCSTYQQRCQVLAQALGQGILN